MAGTDIALLKALPPVRIVGKALPPVRIAGKALPPARIVEKDLPPVRVAASAPALAMVGAEPNKMRLGKLGTCLAFRHASWRAIGR
jgi:hypothetical protein